MQATAPFASAHTPTLVWHDTSASLRLRCPLQDCLHYLTFCTFNRAVVEPIDHNAFQYFPSSFHLGGHRGSDKISSSGQVYPCSYYATALTCAIAVSRILEFHRQSWDHLYSCTFQNFTGSLLISRYGLMTTSERKATYEELRNLLRAIWDNKVRKKQQKVLNDFLPTLLEAYGPAAVEDAKAQIAAIDYETEMERTGEIVAAVRLKVMISAPSSIPCAHLDW
ncbi:hypothetical protein K456DRAFT_40262 [Colletotrichum gloeosporioides 23]|nr:hypothetical protein K456DRAFT_40262 [Colletotrichum gloeosporioides 23]